MKFYKQKCFWIISLIPILFVGSAIVAGIHDGITNPSSPTKHKITKVVEKKKTKPTHKKVKIIKHKKQHTISISNQYKKAKPKKYMVRRKKPSHKKHHKINFNKIILGMSKNEVIKKIGKPKNSRIDESGYLELDYGPGEILYFQNDKLTNGTPTAIANQFNNQQNRIKNKRNKLQESEKLFAQTFGTKSVEYLQKHINFGYATTKVGNTMEYMTQIKSPYGTFKLLRTDDANNFTTVYLHDPNAYGGFGPVLYTGRTIYYENKKPVIIY